MCTWGLSLCVTFFPLQSKLRSLSKYLQTKEVAKDMAKSAKVAEINEPMAVGKLSRCIE